MNYKKASHLITDGSSEDLQLNCNQQYLIHGGIPTIDLFATKENYKCQNFCFTGCMNPDCFPNTSYYSGLKATYVPFHISSWYPGQGPMEQECIDPHSSSFVQQTYCKCPFRPHPSPSPFKTQYPRIMSDIAPRPVSSHLIAWMLAFWTVLVGFSWHVQVILILIRKLSARSTKKCLPYGQPDMIQAQ